MSEQLTFNLDFKATGIQEASRKVLAEFDKLNKGATNSTRDVSRSFQKLLTQIGKEVKIPNLGKAFAAFSSAAQKEVTAVQSSLNKLSAAYSNLQKKIEAQKESHANKMESITKRLSTRIETLTQKNADKIALINENLNKKIALQKEAFINKIAALEVKYQQRLETQKQAFHDRLVGLENRLNDRITKVREGAKTRVKVLEEKLYNTRLRDREVFTRKFIALEEQMNAKIAALQEKMSKKKLFTGGLTEMISKATEAAFSFLVLYETIKRLASIIAKPFVFAYKEVESFNQAVIKTTALITSFQAAEPGMNLAESYKRAKSYSEALVKTMFQLQEGTLTSVEHMLLMTEEMAKQGILLDVNNEKQKEGFKNIANAVEVIAAGSLQKEIQVRQEIRALMLGQVRMNDQLAKQLDAMLASKGGLREQLTIWKAQGTVIENVGNLLQGYAAATDDILLTWVALKNELRSIVDQILIGSFSKAYKDIGRGFRDILEILKSNKELLGRGISAGWEVLYTVIVSIADVLHSVQLAISSVFNILKGTVSAMFSLSGGTSDWNSGLQDAISALSEISSLSELIVSVVEIVSTILKTTVGTTMKTVVAGMKTVYVIVTNFDKLIEAGAKKGFIFIAKALSGIKDIKKLIEDTLKSLASNSGDTLFDKIQKQSMTGLLKSFQGLTGIGDKILELPFFKEMQKNFQEAVDDSMTINIDDIKTNLSDIFLELYDYVDNIYTDAAAYTGPKAALDATSAKKQIKKMTEEMNKLIAETNTEMSITAPIGIQVPQSQELIKKLEKIAELQTKINNLYSESTLTPEIVSQELIAEEKKKAIAAAEAELKITEARIGRMKEIVTIQQSLGQITAEAAYKKQLALDDAIIDKKVETHNIVKRNTEDIEEQKKIAIEIQILEEERNDTVKRGIEAQKNQNDALKEQLSLQKSTAEANAQIAQLQKATLDERLYAIDRIYQIALKELETNGKLKGEDLERQKIALQLQNIEAKTAEKKKENELDISILEKQLELAELTNVPAERLLELRRLILEEQQKGILLDKTQDARLQEVLLTLNKIMNTRLDLEGTDFGAGFAKFLDNLQKTSMTMAQVAQDAGSAMTEAFSTFFFDAFQGKLSGLKDIFVNFLNSIQQSIAKFLADRVVKDMFAFLDGGSDTYGPPAPSGGGGFLGGIGKWLSGLFSKHQGGMITYHNGGGVYRPDFGLKSDERMGKLQVGEGVLSRKGMQALGALNSGAGLGSAKVPNVSLNITNNSGTPLDVEQSSVEFNGEEFVINAFLKKAKSDSRFRNELRGLARG